MSDNTAFEAPPDWAIDAIWYQIFVERFRKGSDTNNPTKESIQYGALDEVPEDWCLTPWKHNWYKKDKYAEKLSLDFYRCTQFRRYGGDLPGVKQKMKYLIDLGITAVYFNPLNFAPSLHKYDASYYHHIDIHFGPAPENDLKLIEKEDPADPNTWVWTEADLFFLDLVKEFHSNNIRVILDFSWNHTGTTFWAFKDLQKNFKNSKCKKWYDHVVFKDNLGDSHFTYKSWYNIPSLPELNKINKKIDKITGCLEGNLFPEVKTHIFEVCRRWIDPLGNGDISQGIDGMRLDVGDHIPMGFWREFRKFVKNINPEFFLVGEIWWKEWPDHLLDPRPWLKGDVFDSVMHYHWFKIARGFFGNSEDNIDIFEFITKMQNTYYDINIKNCKALMNLVASHDSPRLLTSLQNKNKYKHLCKPAEDKNYLTNIPDQETYTRAILLIIHQFTFLGSPHIWNGDEMGMLGADDPDNRKPLIWPDINFENETASSYSDYEYEYKPSHNGFMHHIYKKLISLRKKHIVLSKGDCLFFTEEIKKSNLLMYTRQHDSSKVIVCINISSKSEIIPVVFQKGKPLFQYNITDSFSPEMPPFSAIVKLISV
jgi:cyclomaltodextrinase